MAMGTDPELLHDRGGLDRETGRRSSNKFALCVCCPPPATKPLGRPPRRVAPGKRVKHEASTLRHEFQEELREFNRKARWIRSEPKTTACLEVGVLRAGIRSGEQVRGIPQFGFPIRT